MHIITPPIYIYIYTYICIHICMHTLLVTCGESKYCMSIDTERKKDEDEQLANNSSADMQEIHR